MSGADPAGAQNASGPPPYTAPPRALVRAWVAALVMAGVVGPLALQLSHHDIFCIDTPLVSVHSHDATRTVLLRVESFLQIERARRGHLPSSLSALDTPPPDVAGQPVLWFRVSDRSGLLAHFGRDGVPGSCGCDHCSDEFLWFGASGTDTASPSPQEANAYAAVHNMALRREAP